LSILHAFLCDADKIDFFRHADEYINVVRLPKTSDASKTFSGSAVIATGYGMTANSIHTQNLLLLFMND
jgi:hypothetical protein